MNKETIKEIKETQFVTDNTCDFCGMTEEDRHYIFTTVTNNTFICCASDYKFALNTYFIEL